MDGASLPFGLDSAATPSAASLPAPSAFEGAAAGLNAWDGKAGSGRGVSSSELTRGCDHGDRGASTPDPVRADANGDPAANEKGDAGIRAVALSVFELY
jgi:hypothetical protein